MLLLDTREFVEPCMRRSSSTRGERRRLPRDLNGALTRHQSTAQLSSLSSEIVHPQPIWTDYIIQIYMLSISPNVLFRKILHRGKSVSLHVSALRSFQALRGTKLTGRTRDTAPCSNLGGTRLALMDLSRTNTNKYVVIGKSSFIRVRIIMIVPGGQLP